MVGAARVTEIRNADGPPEFDPAQHFHYEVDVRITAPIHGQVPGLKSEAEFQFELRVGEMRRDFKRWCEDRLGRLTFPEDRA